MLSCLVNNQYLNLINTPYSEKTIQKWSDKGILKCPVCGGTYEFCHGRVIIPYFRHKDKTECDDLYSESETIEHLHGKIDLYNWLSKQKNITNLVLEAWISETKQRPDLMFKYHGDIYVIEFQCTPISSEYYERHELYEAAGIHDIWICGTLNYFQQFHKGKGYKKLNVLEDECRLYYDTETKLLHRLRDLNQIETHMWGVFLDQHRMKDNKDYVQGKENYYCSKDINICYKDKNFIENYSLTYCKPLGEVESFVGDQSFAI